MNALERMNEARRKIRIALVMLHDARGIPCSDIVLEKEKDDLLREAMLELSAVQDLLGEGNG